MKWIPLALLGTAFVATNAIAATTEVIPRPGAMQPGGDPNDTASVDEHLHQVLSMQSTQIEEEGKLVQVTTEFAEVIEKQGGWHEDFELEARRQEAGQHEI